MLQILEIIALEVLSHGICPKHLNQQGHEDICAEAIMLKKKKKEVNRIPCPLIRTC